MWTKYGRNSSGLTFGYKRTIPHILGVILGFPLMTIFVGLGLGKFFEIYPFAFTILKVIGILYLLWLAWHIAKSTPKFKKIDENSQSLKFMPIIFFMTVLISANSWALGGIVLKKLIKTI